MVLLGKVFGGKMKKGSLRSKERSLEAILWKSPTHIRGYWRICVHYLEQTMPRHPQIKPRRGPCPCLATHKRGKSMHMRGSSCLAKMHPRLDVLQEV
ncbi:hypothetical protein PIB30_089980 [Stylosanthes scabra]|uniref:Uncharacterized protein n=1 Tax=Stylosanthes scabra TaxID=79078 RepID=A0ABU6VVZ6_9FABA|nr:hypothetical protein [Stylosanthes scabra]